MWFHASFPWNAIRWTSSAFVCIWGNFLLDSAGRIKNGHGKGAELCLWLAVPQREPRSLACCLIYIHQRCHELQTGISYLFWRTEIPHQSTTWIKGESNRHSRLAHLSDLSLSLVSTLNLIMRPERSLSCSFIPQGTGGMERVFPCQQAPWGLGFPGLSSQASVMEKISHYEQGRARLMEWAQQSRALLLQVHNGVQIYREQLNSEAPNFICSTCPPRESNPSFKTLYEETLKHPWAVERTHSNTRGKTEKAASTDAQVPVALGSTMKIFILNEVKVEVNGFRNSERSLSPHCCVISVTGGRWSCVAQSLWKSGC